MSPEIKIILEYKKQTQSKEDQLQDRTAKSNTGGPIMQKMMEEISADEEMVWVMRGCIVINLLVYKIKEYRKSREVKASKKKSKVVNYEIGLNGKEISSRKERGNIR